LARRVLVVYNRADSDSKAVAKYYARKRGIPAQNLCSISPIENVRLSWTEYVKSVQKPIQKCLNAVGPKNILYIVFTYNTPYRVEGAGKRKPPQGGDLAMSYAIDQYVADIWDQYMTAEAWPQPTLRQPYYDDAWSKLNKYQPFESFADYRERDDAKLIYSVWRLDAPTAQLARSMVDKALEAEANGLAGQACFDRRWDLATIDDTGYGAGDWDLHQAAAFARDAGFAVTEDANPAEFGTPPAPLCPHAAMYSGWYSLNHYNDAFQWQTGAIGFHLDSLSALDPRGGLNWSSNAIKKGITVTSGAIDEPYLSGLLRPGGTFRDLFQGANVGDAFLRNTRYLRWMIVYLGDPLYRPFPGGVGQFKSQPAAAK
jgi:uncharacterized protein (TIGR03790 family)